MRCWPTCRARPAASCAAIRTPNGCAAKPTSPALPRPRRAYSTPSRRSCARKVNYSTQPARFSRPRTAGRSTAFSSASRRPAAATRNSFCLLPNTMASSTACSKSVIEGIRLWLLALVFAPLLAWAAEIDIVNPQLQAGDDGYLLAADFRFELNPRLEEAVAKGVVLSFVADFELTKARWYWLDEKLVSRSQTYRLSYNALTRQYRLSAGSGLHQSFASLSDALQVLSRLRNWVVAERGEKGLRAGDTYEAALRLRLDVTQLPKPFQITALGNKDWSLTSDWRTWQASLPALPPNAAPASVSAPPAPVEAK